MSARPHRPVFRFLTHDYAAETGVLRLHYAHDGFEHFTESFTFLDASPDLTHAQRSALDLCARQLHLAAGVSYYKSALAEKIVVDGAALSRESAAFFEKFYIEGLGEFAYLNGLDLRGRIQFPHADTHERASDLPLPRCTLVPVGGGKDSIVALETLRAARAPIRLFAMGSAPPILETLRVAGLPAVRVTRQIAPALLALNAQGAWNGHVPITGILSFLLPLVAVLYGADAAALANERSANVGNLVRDGQAINHQWSKSHEFERAFAQHIRRTALSGFHYYSLLRPLSELAIAQRFARHENYFPVFNSCNKNFSLTHPPNGARWCGRCPKCLFVFLILAPFVPRDKLLRIFGQDLLAQEEMARGYEELLGLSGHKPFECVGEIDEARVALRLLAARDAWRNVLLVARFAPSLGAALTEDAAEVQTLLAPQNSDNIPAKLQGVFDAVA